MKITDEHKEEMRRLFRAGRTQQQIATAIGCVQSQVYRELSRLPDYKKLKERNGLIRRILGGW